MTRSALDDTDAIYRRAWQIRGEESGVCLKGTSESTSCWCYGLGNPPFRCPVPPDAPQALDPPIGAHDMTAPTQVPWFECVL